MAEDRPKTSEETASGQRRVARGAAGRQATRLHAQGGAAGLRILGLDALRAAQQGRRLPPVERWDPPYCGDIGLAIRADGVWLYRDSPITRLPLVKLFASVLRRDADGRHYLVTPSERIDVAVADAPLLAVEMEVVGAGRDQTLIFRTNLDDIVSVGPQHPLRFAIEAGSHGLKPYVGVRGRLEARVTRALTYDLLTLALEDSQGAPGVLSGGSFFALPEAPPEDAGTL
jgi:hypothetical protein